jgi:pyrroline-5-carboxylate reductase
MNDSTITFIGAGNMANCLIGGLIKNAYIPEKILATSPEIQQLEVLQQRWGIGTTSNNQAAAKKAEIIILAVKPQIIKEVAIELASVLGEKNPLIISIIAGVKINQLEDWLGSHLAIVRCMPNTPALVGHGATVLLANSIATDSDKKIAEKILANVGITEWITDESLMDVVTSLSGSGPAYFFLVMEAIEEAAVQMGLTRNLAKILTAQTALGSAYMAINSKNDISDLRKQVTSPGGGTEQALNVLERKEIRKIFKDALQAAEQRYIELSKQLA